MSVKGKRVIWHGPADGANQKPNNIEAVALAAHLPGTVLTQGATGLSANANAATVTGYPLIVADKDQMRSKSVDDAWTINENMVAIKPRDDETFEVLVATGQTLAIGSPLASNADGTLKLGVPATDYIIAYSEEAVTTTAAQLVTASKA